jgi:hypothetical protein
MNNQVVEFNKKTKKENHSHQIPTLKSSILGRKIKQIWSVLGRKKIEKIINLWSKYAAG